MHTKMWICFLFALCACQSAHSQSDFFWSFERHGQTNAEPVNADAFGDFKIGDEATLYLYYATSGPSESDVTAMFLDIATSNSEVIEFTDAAIWDFGINVAHSPAGRRWLNNVGSVAGRTGDVTSDLIDELHAFTSVDFSISGIRADNNCLVICDSGWNDHADAFWVGEIEFTVVGSGSADILTTAGDGGIIDDGKSFIPQFGGATINVASIPEPSSAFVSILAGLLAGRRRSRLGSSTS